MVLQFGSTEDGLAGKSSAGVEGDITQTKGEVLLRELTCSFVERVINTGAFYLEASQWPQRA